MKQSSTLCQALVQAQLSSHNACKHCHFHGMFQYVLTIAVTEAQSSEEFDQFFVHAPDAELEDRLFTDPLNGLIHFFRYFRNDIFDPSRLDPAVFHQCLQ